MIGAIAFTLAAMVIWAFAGLVIHWGLKNFTEFELLTARFMWALVSYAIWGLWHNEWFNYISRLFKSPRIWLLALIYPFGVISLVFVSFKYAPVGLVGLIWNLAPILAALAGWLFFKERVTTVERLSLVIILVASILLGFVRYPINGEASLLGVIAGISSVILWIVYMFLTKRYLKSLPIHSVNIFSYLVGFWAAFFMVWLLPSSSVDYVVKSLFSWYSIYLGIAATTLANWFIQKAMYVIEVSEINVFMYIQNILAIIFEAIFLDKPLTLIQSLLILLIVVGFIINLYGIRKQRNQQPN